MNCEKRQTEFNEAMLKVQNDLESELGTIAANAERSATELSNEFDQSNDLAEGVGASAGAVIGAVTGGVPGSVLGVTIGKTIGSLFVIETSYENHTVALDVPQVSTSIQEWKFSLPTVVIKDNDIVFNLPELVMKTVEGPKIPQVTCRMETECVGPRWARICTDVPKCTTTWVPTYFDVPTWETREHRIVIGVPNVEMREEKIVIGIPEVSMKRQEITFKIPQVTLRFIKDAGKRTAAGAANIAQEAAIASAQKRLAMKERIRFEVVEPATKMFNCYREQIIEKKNEISATFDPEITKMVDALKRLVSSGVPENDDDYINQKALLDAVIAKRNAAIEKFDLALSKIDEAAKEAIDRLINFED